MNYQQKTRKYLENYKRKYLSSIGKGKWRNSENIYLHILPKSKGNLNLLPEYRNYLSNYMDDNIQTLKRHTYFHHLNSSQAMCLNFFYPLMKEKELEIVLYAIGLENENIEYNSVCFEKKSKVEKVDKNYRATYFDFYMETITGKKYILKLNTQNSSLVK